MIKIILNKMIELEHYKRNLHVIDNFDVKNIKVNKGVVFTGKTDYINEQIKENEHNCPLLGAATIGLDNTAAPIPEKSKYFDIWTDIDAQEIHLNTKPTCYLILGKSGSGAFSLGEAISKKFNCIHLCPKSILIDEISENSSTGRTWDFNMRHNKVCSFDTILTMLKIKLNSAAVQHRGYVISGLPLVTCSRNPLTLINSLHSEEAFLQIDEMLFDIIANIKKKKPGKPPESARSSEPSELIILEEGQEEEEEEEPVQAQQAEEDIEEEEDKPAELPKFVLDFCSNLITNKKAFYKTNQAVLLHQIHELFHLYLPPDIIIHITCPDLDLVKMRSRKYINYKTGQNSFEPFISNYVLEMRWPAKYNISDYENPHDNHVFQPKYNCRSPVNFEERVVEQICNHKKYILPYMEKKIMDFDPKMVIELDGRTSVQQMMHHVIERLVLLHIQPVIIPEPLYLEQPPEDMEEFWATVAELKAIQSGGIHFKYYASPWFNRCPVELKLRRSVIGNPKYAVKFFKHIYLMSSLNQFILFCRNPRPYLKLEYLEPTCRIIITGTKSSGKTMISQCLSWIFNTPITNYQTILETERKKKYHTFAKNILSEIIATIEDSRFLEWQKTEKDRITKLNEWSNTILQKLHNYVPLLLKSIHYKENSEKREREKIQTDKESQGEEQDLMDGDKSKGEDETKEELDTEFIQNFNSLRTQLSFLPILDNIEECKMALANQNISQYTPVDLITETKKPSIPIIGDKDVTVAISNYISANDLQKDLEPNIEEIMKEIVELITAIDTHHQEKTQFKQMYGKYIIDGFPSDPEYWGYISDSKLMPDNTIALIENREIDQDLYEYYTNAEKYTKHYDQTIFLANDPLITTKILATKASDLQKVDMQIIANNVIDDVLDFLFITKIEKEPDHSETNLQAQFITSFTETIEKFNEGWDSVKVKLEEKSKTYIEITLENKSDVKIIEEVLRKLRQSYCSMGEVNEDEEMEVPDEDEDEKAPKDLLTYNDNRFLCETNIYCPIAYYDYHVLWEGKPEFTLKHDNKIHYFSKQEFLEIFRNDITKYQSYNKPYKNLPKLKICIIGALGCGASSVSKQIAKELGLLYINFADIINSYMMPKHFKKVGRRYENIFTDEPLDEEGVVEFQMDEENTNVVSDLISNEKEMRRMVHNYFELGTPLLPMLTQKHIKKIWFDPFVPTGFVLDGYPKIPNDVEDMLACYCIPDILIELDTTSEMTISRMAPIMLQSWKSQQNEAKQVAKTKLDNERKQWMHTITKQIVIKLVIEEIFDNVIINEEEPTKGISTESVIIDAHPSGAASVDPKLFNAYNDMVQEYPEPTDSNVWEKNDEARERIETRLENLYEIDYENVQALKDILMEQRVKIVTIDATKSLNKVIRQTLSKLSVFKYRCESFFEQTFIVDLDIAEILLLKGFYFFSKFNRLCPVYIFENPKTILNSYKISKRKGQLFPVIHRSYIYFISSKENVTKFRMNPLKYITSDVLKSYFEYPLRISVIGAPMSGKSTLAAKLAKENGLICISRGSAIRNVLKNFHWTDLASKLSKTLQEGERVHGDLIVKALQTAAIDHRTVTYGFVFDGIPELPYVAKGLVKNGLYPNIVFDIISDRSKCIENWRNQIYYDIIKYIPPYPYPLIVNKYETITQRAFKIWTWINDDFQNLCLLDGNQSKWHVLQQAHDNLLEATSKINFYVSNVENNIVHAMWISNDAFQQRQSQYKNLCPVCFHKKVYRHMGFPGDKKGVVIYKNKFYWICEEHMDSVMMFPHIYLTSRKIEIPELPAVVNIVNIDYIYENGVCVVTYAENLPAQNIKIGTKEYAASYAGRSYLFCSEVCFHKFLDKPHLYKDITVFKETKQFPKLCIKKLPNIGYLEQSLGNILTEACCSVNVFRPKYPGLSFQTSALIYIALYLKTHNPFLDEVKASEFRKSFRVFEARCKLILNAGLRLRSTDNPFAPYPKCEHKEPTLRPDKTEELKLSSLTIQRPSSARQRTSNYVQIHKPSFVNPLHRTSTVTSQMRRY